MIKLNKGPKPDILSNNADSWRDELLGYIQRDEKIPANVGNRYNHTEVKQSLRAESNSKCMYCESKVSHVSYEHIDHIKPKAKNKFPELTFEWQNLGLACPVCNINKSDDFDHQLPILNPYIDVPEHYLVAVGPYVYARPGNSRGQLTEKLLKLNRVELIEQRMERIESIRQMMNSYENEKNEILKKLLLREIILELQEDKAYSFISNALVKLVGIEAA